MPPCVRVGIGMLTYGFINKNGPEGPFLLASGWPLLDYGIGIGGGASRSMLIVRSTSCFSKRSAGALLAFVLFASSLRSSFVPSPPKA